MKKINPEKFLFELYIGRVGYSVYQVVDSAGRPKRGFKILGYCDARRLPVRPRNEGFAIMVEDTQLPEENIFWLHVETLDGIIKPPAPSIKRKRAKAKDSYTMAEFNKAYVDFRMDKMGNRKEMENIPGIMRAWRSLLHIYINTDGMNNDEHAKVMMHGLQYELGIRMQYAHGPEWVIKAADTV